MDKIKLWALTVSTVSIISGVILSLLPKNAYKKYYKFIVGIMLVYTFLQPIIGKNSIDFDITDYLKDNYEVSDNIDKYAQSAMVDSAEKAIEAMFTEFADKNSIDCKIRCKCRINNRKITVDKIYIINSLSEEKTILIEEFAVSAGFDESILIYMGDNIE